VALAPPAMMVMAGAMTGSYGLLNPTMVTIDVASVVISNGPISSSQSATRADSLAHRLSCGFPPQRALREAGA
jgi:H+/Cl- antiporter ClcA